jgi:Helix-turn-helix of DDE superfamily endonuclease
MITYEKILKKPQVANNLIGMSLEEFEKLYIEFEHAHFEQVNTLQYTRRHKLKRRRAVGAGRKHKYALRDRLLITLFWLRAYTTYNVLGTVYELDKTTVEDYLNHVMRTLSTMTNFHFERPQADVPKLRSVQEVIRAFPDVLILLASEDKDDKLFVV